MPQVTFNINTELLFIILAGFAIVISLWMIAYFGSKIALDIYNKSQIGDMPSAEEITAHYKELNDRLLGVVDGLFIHDLSTSENSQDETTE